MANKTETQTEKLEREYTIPLRREWSKVPSYKRAKKAVKAVKEFLARHMKVPERDLKMVKIDKYLNEELWFRGIKKPPAKIKVKATKDNETGNVIAELFEMPEKLKFKKAREERREQKSEDLKGKKESRKKDEPEAEKKQDEGEKVEEKEKKSASLEVEKQIEKEMAKETKHTSKTKSPKQEKNDKVKYNKSSRGR